MQRHKIREQFLLLILVIFFACTKKNDEPQPVITSFYPLRATKQDPVRIVGRHFLTTKQVYFGDAPALNFKVLNDTILLASVHSGNSGKIRVETNGGSVSSDGFIYYTPVIYRGIETAKFVVSSWPQLVPLDSANIQLEGSIQILESNKYDSLRNQYNGYGGFPVFAEDENYVRLEGLVPVHYNPQASLATPGFWRFGTNIGLVIYARKTATGFDIPSQWFYSPINGPIIHGTAIIVNGKLTLNYVTEQGGGRKSATLVGQ